MAVGIDNLRKIDPIVQHITLEANALSIGYKKKRKKVLIAEELNFAIPQGTLTAIIGVNGVGKSTLLRTLGNVQPKLNGTIFVQEKNQLAYTPLQLASVLSLVLTESIASKNLTVIELIALGRQPYTNWIGKLSTKDKEKIHEAIARVQLESLQNQKCYELSDGQLQKVMIARALAQDTPIILLDEPTSHLDLYHKAHILKLLKSIAHETNKTIVFTTHEIEVAIQLCDMMLILEKEKSHFGTPNELIAQKKVEQLFPTDTITFDANSRSFKVKE